MTIVMMAIMMVVVVAMTTLMHGRAPTGLEHLLGEAQQRKKSKRENDAPVAMKRRRHFLRMCLPSPCSRSIVHDLEQ